MLLTGFYVADGDFALFSKEFWNVSTGFSLLALVVLLISTIFGFFRNSDGHSVARQFGGILLTHEGITETIDGEDIVRPLTLNEKRCLNIIEEKALAASIEVPPLYLIPDKALNAFAAGKTKNTAIVAITQGSLDNFNRDELEGIISHELGHIISEDVKLNIRVAALVFGFSAFLVIGRLILQNSMYSRGKSKGAAILIGIGILIVGLFTVFFGRILQAAMSREREYLADASAVQFTRHPDGLASAFKKLDSLTDTTTEIESENAHEFSHAFIFGLNSDILSTHPPLKERIKRITNL